MLKTIALAAGLTGLLAVPAFAADHTVDNEGHVTNCSLDIGEPNGPGNNTPHEISRETGRHCTALNSGKQIKYAAQAAHWRAQHRHWDASHHRWNYY